MHKKSKAGLSHSGPCRARLLEALMDTPEGRARLEAYEERVDQAIADRVEAADKAMADESQPRPVPEAPAREIKHEPGYVPSPVAGDTPRLRQAPVVRIMPGRDPPQWRVPTQA